MQFLQLDQFPAFRISAFQDFSDISFVTHVFLACALVSVLLMVRGIPGAIPGVGCETVVCCMATFLYVIYLCLHVEPGWGVVDTEYM